MTLVFSRETLRPLSKFRNSKIITRSLNSHDWLKRRELDRYIELAKQKNYRCRSAFKLIEIDDRYKIIKPGHKVLDIGAAPGSWSQVLADRTNSNGHDLNSPVGLVIAVDLKPFQSIEGVTILPLTDFTEESSHTKILKLLGEQEKFDFVFSDMAPSASGIANFDQVQILNLVYSVFIFSIKNLKIGGGCLAKLWEGGQTGNVKTELSKFFNVITCTKPNSSYRNSSEFFMLARGFKGLKT